MSCVYGAVQLLVLLLVQLLVLLLFSKIYHRHLHLFNHLLVKAVIKRQEDKLLERKWRKCLKIAEIKKVKENSQRPKPVQIQRKNNFSKTFTSMQNLQENVHNLTQTMTQEFLGQMMNQGVPRNPPPSHYQPSNFGSPVTSSFSCESNSQRNPNLGESSNISERHNQNNSSICANGRGKTYYSC